MSALEELEQTIGQVAGQVGGAVVGIGRGWGRGSGVVVAEQSMRPYEDTQRVLIAGLGVLGVLVSGVTAANV